MRQEDATSEAGERNAADGAGGPPHWGTAQEMSRSEMSELPGTPPEQKREKGADSRRCHGKGFTFLELFAGLGGPTACIQRLVDAGWDGYTYKEEDIYGGGGDVSDEGHYAIILRRIDAGVCWCHMAPPCSTFSGARRSDAHGSVPVLRTESKPEGWGDAKAEEGNVCARRAAAVGARQVSLGNLFSIENPEDSLMWRLPELQKLSGMRGVHRVVLDQCARGGMARKRTALLTNAPWLAASAARCEDAPPHKHVKLEGKVWSHKYHKQTRYTGEAAEYPWALCSRWAELWKEWTEGKSREEQKPPLEEELGPDAWDREAVLPETAGESQRDIRDRENRECIGGMRPGVGHAEASRLVERRPQGARGAAGRLEQASGGERRSTPGTRGYRCEGDGGRSRYAQSELPGRSGGSEDRIRAGVRRCRSGARMTARDHFGAGQPGRRPGHGGRAVDARWHAVGDPEPHTRARCLSEFAADKGPSRIAEVPLQEPGCGSTARQLRLVGRAQNRGGGGAREILGGGPRVEGGILASGAAPMGKCCAVQDSGAGQAEVGWVEEDQVHHRHVEIRLERPGHHDGASRLTARQGSGHLDPQVAEAQREGDGRCTDHRCRVLCHRLLRRLPLARALGQRERARHVRWLRRR